MMATGLLFQMTFYRDTVDWINESIGTLYTQELVDDILSLLASFSEKIYGR